MMARRDWARRSQIKNENARTFVDQEFAIHSQAAQQKVVSVRAFLAWGEALETAGLRE